MCERFCLWTLKANVLYISVKTSTRRGYSSCVHVYVCVHVGLSQQVVARDWCIGGWKQRTCSTVELSVSTAFMYLLRMAKISLLRIWYFLMRSAIFFNGCRGKTGKKRIKMYKSPRIFERAQECEGKTRWTEQTHHVLDDLVLAVLSLHFEEVIAEVKEVKATLLSQQHNDGAASPVQPVPKALSVSQSMQDSVNTDSMSLRHKFGKVKSVWAETRSTLQRIRGD